MNFTEWLAHMRKNESDIGELARAVAIDASWPREATTRMVFITYLGEHNPSMVTTCSRAWGIYQTALKRAAQGQEKRNL